MSNLLINGDFSNPSLPINGFDFLSRNFRNTPANAPLFHWTVVNPQWVFLLNGGVSATYELPLPNAIQQSQIIFFKIMDKLMIRK